MKFYIFRHGQSTWNVLGRTQGHSNDSVLSDKGILQANELGQKLKDRGIEAIFCSPLNRAKQTASIVNEYLNVPIIIEEAFIEVNVGVIEGMKWQDIANEYGEQYKKWKSEKLEFLDFSMPKGESKRQVRERVLGKIVSIADEKKYETVAISGHGITLSQVLQALTNSEEMEIPNASAILIEYKDGNFINHGFV